MQGQAPAEAQAMQPSQACNTSEQPKPRKRKIQGQAPTEAQTCNTSEQPKPKKRKQMQGQAPAEAQAMQPSQECNTSDASTSNATAWNVLAQAILLL
jgi:hypothetical protein